jgi:hypothetical protein
MAGNTGRGKTANSKSSTSKAAPRKRTTTTRARPPKSTSAAVAEAEPNDVAPPASDEGKEKPPVIDSETHAKYEEVKRGSVHITQLQKMTVVELHEVAKQEGLEEFSGLKKQDLIFKILKQPHPPDRDDVRRGRARDPARRVRVPAQPGVQLPAGPG